MRLGMGMGMGLVTGSKSTTKLLQDSGAVMTLIASKADRYNNGLNSPFTNPFKDCIKTNDATLVNFAQTTSDGYDTRLLINSNGTPSNYSNMVSNGDLSGGTTGWSSPYGTLTTSAGYLVNTVTATNVAARIDSSANLNTVNGNRYYVRAIINSPKLLTCEFKIGATLSGAVQALTLNTDSNVSAIVTATATLDPMRLYMDRGGVLVSTDVVKFKSFMPILLTGDPIVTAWENVMGRNITVAECDLLFPFVVSTGTSKASARTLLTADGVDSYGTFVNTSDVDITGTIDFAITTGFMAPSTLQSGYLIAKTSDATGATRQYIIYIGADGSILIYFAGLQVYLSATGKVTPNNFHDLRVFRIGGRLIVVLNGVELTNIANSSNLVSQPNMRLFATSSNAGGTTHTSYGKLSLAWITLHKGTNCTQVKIDKAINAIAKDYRVVA